MTDLSLFSTFLFYISRVSALGSVLTDRRLDSTIESMKVFLQKKQYGEAVINALREIEFLIQLGELEFRERVNAIGL
jgi:hypothetical protein